MSNNYWYAWHPADFANDTQHLTWVERALYRGLLDVHWRDGSLPDDMDRLHRLSCMPRDYFDQAIQEVLLFFHKEDEQPGRLFQKRMQIEIANAENRIRSAEKAARASVESRRKSKTSETGGNGSSTAAERPLNGGSTNHHHIHNTPPDPPNTLSQDSGSGTSVTSTSTEICSDPSQEPPVGVVRYRGGVGECKKLSTGGEAEIQPAATRPVPPAAPASVSLPDGLDRKAWDDYESHRREIKARKLKPASIERQARWLVEQGPPEIQREIVDQTIRNAWTGLFELKANGARPAMSAIDKLKASGWIDDNETGTTLEGEFHAED